jgi:hypothetical protein
VSQEISLCGDWQFTYSNALQQDAQSTPLPPGDKDYTVTMPVPGYWDDHIDRVRLTPSWRHAIFNSRARPIQFPAGVGLGDAELPYLIGVGWYRRNFFAPTEWSSRTVSLCLGAAQETWVWVNGVLAGHHYGESTTFELVLEAHLKLGQENELCIAVANLRADHDGCATRGYAGRSAGFNAPVSLRIGGAIVVQSLYVYGRNENQELVWNLDVRQHSQNVPEDWQCSWQVRDPEDGRTLGEGIVDASTSSAQWTTGNFEMQEWSDRSPKLYELHIRLQQNGCIQDEYSQPFGLRRFERDGTLLRLNGSPIYLRGATESHYFPLTCTAPLSKEYYRKNIGILKSFGFNWLRFHTWVPNKSHLEAADELGMLIQVEPPYGTDESGWIEILRACRRHPSVVLYCGGNEELLDEERIESLRRQHAIQRNEVPDALFSPMEALRGVEYHGHLSDLGDDAVPSPIAPEQLVNPHRLKLLQEFSDVFASLFYDMEYGWPASSILWRNRTESTRGDWRSLGGLWRWLEDDHPHLLHELAILGTYLDLDLEHRYQGTRTGTDLYSATRQHLAEEGVLNRASLYFRNSGVLAAMWRKYHIELSRRCPQAQGYDLLGAIDFHWHRTGYPCGLLNEFYELKPGETQESVLRYNSETVLLLDHSTQRNFYAGDEFDLELLISHYGAKPIIEADVNWLIKDDEGLVYRRGRLSTPRVDLGKVVPLGDIRFVMPQSEQARKLTLKVRLLSNYLEVENQWDFWVFPKRPSFKINAGVDEASRKTLEARYSELDRIEGNKQHTVRIVSEVDDATAEFLNNGGRVLLLWQDPEPEVEHTLRPMSAGRPWGDCTTVVADHPLFRNFPNDGFCAWQFYSLLHHANPPAFNGLDLTFDPILEVVSSYKRVRKQALLFEYSVGNGKLLGCSLSFHWDDPATCWFADELMSYVAGDRFSPKDQATIEQIRKLISRDTSTASVFKNDQALDPNARSANI